ncbi:hypothetical protein FKM82_031134 [Ascaphus truei]
MASDQMGLSCSWLAVLIYGAACSTHGCRVHTHARCVTVITCNTLGIPCHWIVREPSRMVVLRMCNASLSLVCTTWLQARVLIATQAPSGP